MPDPVSATIGVSTLYSGYQANRASRRADRTANKALAFDMQKYNDWKEIYGPIEKNLSNYYTSLTPEGVTAQGFENIQTEFQKVQTQIEENLIQRGLEDSGIQEATNQNLQIQKALAKAKVRQEAPEKVAQQQTAFLQGGEQRRAQAEQGVSRSLHSAAQRSDANAAASAQAFGTLLNLGLSNLPGIDTPESTATSATMRA